MIAYFKWLTEVLQCLGGTPLQVVTTERLQFKKMAISFVVPLRQDLGTMMPIVASGKESLVQMTYERTAIKVCLLELESYGYLIPYCHGSKSKHFDRINMILLVYVRAFHEKMYMT